MMRNVDLKISAAERSNFRVHFSGSDQTFACSIANRLKIRGRTVHQIGLPYHWGSRGLTTGDTANDLSSIVLDPNVHIQEVKAFSVGIKPGRRARAR